MIRLGKAASLKRPAAGSPGGAVFRQIPEKFISQSAGRDPWAGFYPSRAGWLLGNIRGRDRKPDSSG
jgi:hypothetical protein